MKFVLTCTLSCFCLILLSQTSDGLSAKYLQYFNQLENNSIEEKIREIGRKSSVIGLGEVSHYTKECYDLKSKIIQILWKEGYQALILEVDFGQALYWNEYVTNGIGDLDSLIATSGWFTYRTQEFKSLIQSIRQYNLQHPAAFQIFGMEMTSVQHNIKWFRNFLESAPITDNELVLLLSQKRKVVAFELFDQQERLDYWNLFLKLDHYLKKNEKILRQTLDEEYYDKALRIVEIFRQFACYISQDDSSLQSELRDQFSARNVIWCMNQLEESDKTIIWAHNGHITKKSILFNYDVLGHYLNKWFGEAYYSIGFTFNHGEFGSFSDHGFKKWRVSPIQQTSITTFLHSDGNQFAFYDIRSHLNAEKDMQHYIYQDQYIRRDISEYRKDDAEELMKINLSKSYDALFYVEKTNFPTSIEWIQIED